jgi:hypothetical protein
MSWFKSKKKRVIWTDIQIDLYERQIAAAQAIGDKWCLHPSRRAEPLARKVMLRLVK